MTVQIKDTLKLTRNPTEYDFKLQNRTGTLLQVVGDGWCRIEFEGLFIRIFYKEKKRRMSKLVHLEWYVHEQDFYISQQQRAN